MLSRWMLSNLANSNKNVKRNIVIDDHESLNVIKDQMSSKYYWV